MGIRTIAAIPTLGESPWLEQMVTDLLEDQGVDAVWLFDNTKGGGFAPLVGRVLRLHSWRKNRRLHAHKASGSIYSLWNMAIRQARLAYPPSDFVALALLNDDLELAPRSVSTIARRLYHDEWAILGMGLAGGEPINEGSTQCREVMGTYRLGGLNGCAFLLNPHHPAIDFVPDCFNWWYGDDHLVNETRARAGRVGVCDSVRVVHHASTTGNAHWDRLAPLVAADTAAYRERWGDT